MNFLFKCLNTFLGEFLQGISPGVFAITFPIFPSKISQGIFFSEIDLEVPFSKVFLGILSGNPEKYFRWRLFFWYYHVFLMCFSFLFIKKTWYHSYKNIWRYSWKSFRENLRRNVSNNCWSRCWQSSYKNSCMGELLLLRRNISKSSCRIS